MPDPSIVVVIPGAGRSKRFGAVDKLTALLGSDTVLHHTLRAAVAAGPAGIVLVLRRGAPDPPDSGTLVVRLEDAEGGMGRSIAAGVRAAPDADGWLIWPADMPLVRSDTARRIMERYDTERVAVPTYEGRTGHPVLFPACCGPALVRLSADVGARSVRDRARTQTVPVDDPGILFDIDTPDDLRTAESILS